MPTVDPKDNVFVPPIVPPLPMHAAMETTLSGEVRKSRLSKEAISLSLIPGEAGVVAILGAITATMNMITETFRRDAVVRVTMDKELLKRHDEVTVKNMERGDRFLSVFEGLLPK